MDLKDFVSLGIFSLAMGLDGLAKLAEFFHGNKLGNGVRHVGGKIALFS